MGIYAGWTLEMALRGEPSFNAAKVTTFPPGSAENLSDSDSNALRWFKRYPSNNRGHRDS